MRILIASPEAVPYAKTGGLADVAGALLAEFRRRGEAASLVMPLYAGLKDRFRLCKTDRSFILTFGGHALRAEVWTSDFSAVPQAYFIDCDELFNRKELYGTLQGDYHDNALRFAFFSRAVLEVCLAFDISPDVIHCNDWQTGLLPLFLKDFYSGRPGLGKTATVMTIHNLGYQGVFNKAELRNTGLGWEYFTVDKIEFHDMLNYLKAGLIYSDVINTVSITYAREILRPEFGFGLDGLLRSKKADLYGIINGIDYHEFDPATDAVLPARYDMDHAEGRSLCRKALIEKAGLHYETRPVIGVISRLTSQKGLDLVAGSLEELAGMGANVVLLGKGEEYYHGLLAELAGRLKGRVSVTIGFSEEYARLIYAGTDFFLMPSLYEPCGLGQLIALRYGAVPVARKTGGLADTIVDYDERSWTGTGFLFEAYSVAALLSAVRRGLAVFENRDRFGELRHDAMAADFSWERSALRYMQLYHKALAKVSG